MLRRKPKLATSSENDVSTSKLPAKPLKSELFLKSILDQKFNQFGIELHQEFDRQVTTVNSELRDAIFRESKGQKNINRLIIIFLSAVLILLVGNIFFTRNTIESNVQSAVAKELTLFDTRNREMTKSLFIPIQQSIEKNLMLVSSELSLNRGYIDVFTLEGLARNGSKPAFDELMKTLNRGGTKGAFAENKLKELKNYFSILAEPNNQNLTLGDHPITKNGQTALTDSLSVGELISGLKSPNITLSQAHQILTLVWNQTLTIDDEQQLHDILQNTRNLPAAIATCSILQKNFGAQGSMYDFAKWKTFLESRK